MADGELAQGAGTQADAPEAHVVLLPGDGLHGVAHDIEHGLDHLLAVDQQIRNARVVVAHQSDAALAFRFDQVGDALQHLVDIGHCQRRQLVRAKHAVDQVTQAVGLFDDDVGVVLELFVGQFARQQLCCAANAAEWILDFVGQAAHQQFGGFLLGQLRLFLGDAQQAITRVHLQQQQGFTLAEQWRDGVVHGQRLASDRGQYGFTLVERMCLLHRLAQG